MSHRHNFPMVGGKCLYCDITQLELNAQFKPKPKLKIDVGIKRKQTPLQYLVGLIWEALDKPKYYEDLKGVSKPFFPLLLGLVKRKGMHWGWEMLSMIKEWQRLEKGRYPLKLLMWNSKKNGVEKN